MLYSITSLKIKSFFYACSLIWSAGEKEYYERQFETLKSFDAVDRLVQADIVEGEEEYEEQRQAERAMKISNYANVVLLVFKVLLFT